MKFNKRSESLEEASKVSDERLSRTNQYNSNKSTKNDNLRILAERHYSSSSDSYNCQRETNDYEDKVKNPSTPMSYGYNDGSSQNSIVVKEETKTQPKLFANSKYGEPSERSIGQYPLQPPRKHHRNIALETGRKAEQKESEDQDQPMKTVYPDSSRYDGIRDNRLNDPLSTLQAQKVEDKRKIRDALGSFSLEILEESLQSLQERMEADIKEVGKKYEKLMGPIKQAIYYKFNES
jgi:hypothetical protein